MKSYVKGGQSAMMNDNLFDKIQSQYGIRTSLPEDATIAMAYVPFQMTNTTQSPEQGLSAGTMFPILDKPFIGCGRSKK